MAAAVVADFEAHVRSSVEIFSLILRTSPSNDAIKVALQLLLQEFKKRSEPPSQGSTVNHPVHVKGVIRADSQVDWTGYFKTNPLVPRTDTDVSLAVRDMSTLLVGKIESELARY